MERILETGSVVLLFSAVFLAGKQVHPFRRFVRDPRSVISFGAGMAVAYVFVYLIPELHTRRNFVRVDTGAVGITANRVTRVSGSRQ
jgi:hypothetical protein